MARYRPTNGDAYVYGVQCGRDRAVACGGGATDDEEADAVCSISTFDKVNYPFYLTCIAGASMCVGTLCTAGAL